MWRARKLALIVIAAALALVPLPRDAVERLYSGAAYPIIQQTLTRLSNVTPFAWLDVAVLVAAASITAMWVVRLRRRRTGVLGTAATLGLDTAAIAAVFYIWFVVAWGLNYRREPLRSRLDFQQERITSEALRALAARNVHSLNALHGAAHAEGWPDLAALRSTLAPAFDLVQRELSMEWRTETGRPKRTLFTFYFTRVAIDGMTDPFFLETLTNETLLPFERAATVAHEWSHLAGFADESEASFVGWLVCMRGPSAVQYSGWLSLYGTVMNALAKSDRDALFRELQQGPLNDLRAISDRIRRQQLPAASRVANAVYDRYLKANRVEAGIRSYGEVLRLLLGTKFNADGSPVIKEQRDGKKE
jgi:hypothetical protein